MCGDNKIKLVILYSSIYDRTFHELRGENYTPHMEEFGKKYVEKLKQLWEKNENKIFEEISRVSGLKWKKPLIDCYVVKKCRPFSSPLTISIYGKDNKKRKMEHQIETIIHELIHNILVQNGKWVDWREKYPGINRITNNHILVHAIMKKVMENIYGKERAERHIHRTSRIPEYRKAWEIVEKEGAEKIISCLHNN